MRNFFKVLVGFILFLTIIFNFPTYVAFKVLSKPETYTKSLDDSGIYGELNVWASNEIAKLTEESFDEAVDESPDFSGTANQYFSQQFLDSIFDQAEEITIKYFNKFVSAEAIQDLTNNNITVFFDFLNDKYDEPVVYLPKEKFVNDIQREIPNFIADVRAVFESVRTCSESEVTRSQTDISFRLDCFPQDIRDNFDKLFESDFENEFQTEIDRIKEDIAELGEGNIVTFRELDTFSGQDDIQDTEEIIDNMENVRDVYKVSKFAFSVSLSIPIFIAVLFILLVKGNGLKKIFELSVVLALGFGFVLIFATSARAFTTKQIDINDIELSGDAAELPKPVAHALVKFTQNLGGEIVDPIILISTIIFVISFIDIFVFYILVKKAQDKDGMSNKSTESAEDKKDDVQAAGIERN